MPSKFSPRLGKRGVLNSKRGNKNYFKGYNSRIEGTHSTKGAYFIREERLLRIIAPDLSGFTLKPYVHAAVKQPRHGQRVPEFSAAEAAAAPGSSAGGGGRLQ